MNFAKLQELGVERHARALLNTGGMLIFQHIPKTAGSSVTRELAAAVPPYKNIHAEFDGSQIVLDMNAAIEAFLDEHETRQFSSASGHLRLPHLRRIREAVKNARVFTFLRDPVDRVISDYRYARTPKHPPHKQFVMQFPTLESYVDDPAHQNKMWRFLSGEDYSEDAMERIFRRMAFIGLLDDISLHFSYVTATRGCPMPVRQRVNVTANVAENDIAISDGMRDHIRQANPADRALYDRVKTILGKHRTNIEKFVAERRALYA